MTRSCSTFCEVCGCHVERSVTSGSIKQCGLDMGVEADLDYGYMSDCPFDIEEPQDYGDYDDDLENGDCCPTEDGGD